MRIRLPISVTDCSQITNFLANTQILKGRTTWRDLPSIFLILHDFDYLPRFFSVSKHGDGTIAGCCERAPINRRRAGKLTADRGVTQISGRRLLKSRGRGCAVALDIMSTYGGSAVGATRSRNFDCDPLRSPCVLPQVPYRDMRRRQRRGVKLSGQCNLNREIGSRIARGSCDCQPESGRVLEHRSSIQAA
jgi:hypothetical protein